MRPLTPAQTRVLEFVRTYIAREKVPPTRREIAEALGFRSNNAAEEHLVALQRKGFVFLRRGIARGVSLP